MESEGICLQTDSDIESWILFIFFWAVLIWIGLSCYLLLLFRPAEMGSISAQHGNPMRSL